MKRGSSRDISPSSKRSRSSLARYDDSSEDDRRSRGASPMSRRYVSDSMHRGGGGDYGRNLQRSSSPPYKVLCVSNLHPKASDDMVRDALYREFKKFGDASVKVTVDSDGERVAYVYFRNSEEAREAKRGKRRILFYDRPVLVDPVYDSLRDYSIPSHARSRSPLDYERSYRPRSPPVPEIDDRYEPRFDRARPPMGAPREYYDGPPMGMDEYGFRHHRGRGGPQHYGPPRGGFKPNFGGGRGGGGMMDSKRDKFPNYLHHVAPEDDPLSTRTLFAGNLEINIADDELRRIFARFGVVDDIDIKRPPPGTGNAYAFVRFQNLDMAHRAKLELSGQYIGKFQCKIGYGKVLPTNRVWVGGLGPWTSLNQLNQEFDRFGAIKKIDYRKGENQAYILYESLDAAQAAVKEMRGFQLGGPDKKLRTDFAEVAQPAGGSYPTASSEYNEEWSASGSRNYDEYGGENYNYGRGRGRGRGWHDRGGRGRGGSYGDYSRGGEFDGPEGTDNVGSENTESQLGLSSSGSLADVIKKTTTAWQGTMLLKNSTFSTKFHVLEGEPEINELLQDSNGTNYLKITQRLRLDQPKLDDVTRRLNSPSNATILLSLSSSAVPAIEEEGVQNRPFRNLVAYLKQKESAGVISLNSKEGSNTGGVLYAFPPCDFSLQLMRRVSPALTESTTREDHLVIVIDRGSNTA